MCVCVCMCICVCVMCGVCLHVWHVCVWWIHYVIASAMFTTVKGNTNGFLDCPTAHLFSDAQESNISHTCAYICTQKAGKKAIDNT